MFLPSMLSIKIKLLPKGRQLLPDQSDFPWMYIHWSYGKIHFCIFFMLPPAKGSSGAYSVPLWCNVCTCICRVCNQSLTNSRICNQSLTNIQVYTCVSLGGQNLGTFYARKLKFGMLHTQTWTFNSGLELPLGHVLCGTIAKMYTNEYTSTSL